jgi:hypothetical protein
MGSTALGGAAPARAGLAQKVTPGLPFCSLFSILFAPLQALSLANSGRVCMTHELDYWVSLSGREVGLLA